MTTVEMRWVVPPTTSTGTPCLQFRYSNEYGAFEHYGSTHGRQTVPLVVAVLSPQLALKEGGEE